MPTPGPTPTESVQLSSDVRSSARWQRDVLLGASGVAAIALPGQAGAAVGVGFGAMSVVTGLGELRAGMRSRDTALAVDGTLHVLAGGALAAAGVYSSTLYAPYLAAGAAALLLAKQGVDRPGSVLAAAGRETLGLARDTVGVVGGSVRDGLRSITGRTES